MTPGVMDRFKFLFILLCMRMTKGSRTLITHCGHVEVFTSPDASAQLLNVACDICAILGFGQI
jgi:hypothetical protein